MRKSHRYATILLFSFAFLLQGCATGYQRDGLTGGFSETRLDENVFTVTFRGNGYTKRERVADFTLLRCAELTLESGYAYFVIIDASTFTKIQTYKTNEVSHTTGNAHVYGNNVYGSSRTVKYGGDTEIISKPGASNTIVCFKEKPEGTFSYNAKFIRQSISQKYGIVIPATTGGQ